MDSIDYKKLYELQDKVLDVIFSFEHEFYLTGGTCLSRFYHEKRYSDDLDFFANSSNNFGFRMKRFKQLLEENFTLKVEIESKDFVRYLIDDSLQLDFVNDRVSRYKDVVILDNGYVIDNIENILSNKLTAIIGRDNPKDIFDLYLIVKYNNIDWDEIILSAKDKTNFAIEDLQVRLKSFPKSWLKKINLIDETFLDNFDEEFNIIIENIVNS
jgi:predicted nucleotidyltransferase component of viral defense system